MNRVTKLNTQHFSEVEVAARDVAQTVSDLKAELAACQLAATACWVGEGREGFNNLCFVVNQQLEDISSEFWSLFDSLVSAEVAYLEADQEMATKIHSELVG